MLRLMCGAGPGAPSASRGLIVTNETGGFLQGQLGGRVSSLQASDVDQLISMFVVSPYYLNGLCVQAAVCSGVAVASID